MDTTGIGDTEQRADLSVEAFVQSNNASVHFREVTVSLTKVVHVIRQPGARKYLPPLQIDVSAVINRVDHDEGSPTKVKVQSTYSSLPTIGNTSLLQRGKLNNRFMQPKYKERQFRDQAVNTEAEPTSSATVPVAAQLRAPLIHDFEQEKMRGACTVSTPRAESPGHPAASRWLRATQHRIIERSRKCATQTTTQPSTDIITYSFAQRINPSSQTSVQGRGYAEAQSIPPMSTEVRAIPPIIRPLQQQMPVHRTQMWGMPRMRATQQYVPAPSIYPAFIGQPTIWSPSHRPTVQWPQEPTVTSSSSFSAVEDNAAPAEVRPLPPMLRRHLAVKSRSQPILQSHGHAEDRALPPCIRGLRHTITRPQGFLPTAASSSSIMAMADTNAQARPQQQPNRADTNNAAQPPRTSNMDEYGYEEELQHILDAYDRSQGYR
ncbi:unnamed protein product [Sphagnum balticum]